MMIGRVRTQSPAVFVGIFGFGGADKIPDTPVAVVGLIERCRYLGFTDYIEQYKNEEQAGFHVLEKGDKMRSVT